MDEITAEFAVQELLPVAPLRIRSHVTFGGRTDLGRVRENNEDKFEFFLPEDERTLVTHGITFLLCDGMGGHAAGQIASELAAKTFLSVYYGHMGGGPTEAMAAGVTAANRFVCAVGGAVATRRGLGSTLTGLILIEDVAWLVHAGDSRLYRLRDGEMTQLSQDHTVMEELIRTGVLTPEQAQHHPQRHAILRCIGLEEGVVPQIESFDLREDDRFFLCSDGVANHVPDERIHRLLADLSPSEAARRAIDDALFDGGSDNATAMVVRVDRLEPVEPPAEADDVVA